MIAKNTTVNMPCMACLNCQGEKKVVDAFFEAGFEGNFIVLTRCQACGGVTKITHKANSASYVSGPRKPLYKIT